MGNVETAPISQDNSTIIEVPIIQTQLINLEAALLKFLSTSHRFVELSGSIINLSPASTMTPSSETMTQAARRLSKSNSGQGARLLANYSSISPIIALDELLSQLVYSYLSISYCRENSNAKLQLNSTLAELPGAEPVKDLLKTNSPFFVEFIRPYVMRDNSHSVKHFTDILDRVVYLYRQWTFERHCDAVYRSTDVFRPPVVDISVIGSMQLYCFTHNTTFGRLHIHKDNLRYSQQSKLCMIYLDAANIELHDIDIISSLRAMPFADHAYDHLSPTVRDFVMTTCGRKGSVQYAELIDDYSLTVLFGQGKRYRVRSLSMDQCLTDVFDNDVQGKVTTVYLKRRVGGSNLDSEVIQVLIKFEMEDSVTAVKCNYQHLFEGDQKSTVQDLLSFLTKDIFKLMKYEFDAYHEELIRCIIVFDSSGAEKVKLDQFTKKTPLSQIMKKIRIPLGTKANMLLQEGKPVDLVAVVQCSEEYSFDYLPQRAAKYKTKIKFPFEKFLNFLLESSVKWSKIDTIDNMEALKDLLPGHLVIDYHSIKDFANLPNRLKLHFMEHHTSTLGLPNSYITHSLLSTTADGSLATLARVAITANTFAADDDAVELADVDESSVSMVYLERYSQF